MLNGTKQFVKMAESEPKGEPLSPSQSLPEKNLTKIENPIDVLIHELKQPLLCILILGERIERIVKDLQTETVPKAPNLKRDVHALLSSIQQMREILGARSALANLKWLDFKWGLNLHGTLDALEAVAQSKGITLEIDNTETSREAGPDTGAIGQILNNLVTNALHAVETAPREDNSEKKILIKISSAEEILKIEVHDNGPGFVKTNMDRLFERGYTTKTNSGGSGYGLWLCRKLSEALNGNIKASTSPLLGGACFECSISLTRQQEQLDDVA